MSQNKYRLNIKSRSLENLENARQVLKAALSTKHGFIHIPPSYLKDFDLYYSRQFVNYMRTTLFLTLILFTLSAFLDLFLLQNVKILAMIRFGLVTPILVILTLFSLTKYFLKHQQFIMIMASLTLTFGLFAIACYVTPELKGLYLDAVLIIQIFSFTLARIKHLFATGIILISWLMLNSILWYGFHFSSELLWGYNYLYLSTSCLAITTGILMNQNSRRTYLQARLLDLEKRHLAIVNDRLESLATIDGLTGVANHRYFLAALLTEWRRACRFNYPISLLMIDLNHFKQLNDQYGHQIGDQCLQQFAFVVNQFVRRTGDLVARYGGDEFAMILVATDLEGAYSVANSIKNAVEKINFYEKKVKTNIQMSACIGITSAFPEKDIKPRDLINQADQALYRAKKSNDNIVIYDSLTL